MPLPPDIKLFTALLAAVAAAVARWSFSVLPVACLAGFALGLLYAGVHAAYWLDQRLPAGPDAAEGTIVGTVDGFAARRDRLTRIELKLHHPVKNLTPTDKPLLPGLFYGRVRLNCYNCEHELAPGQVWRFAVRLRGIHGLANPGLFDYERWAFQRRLVASGTLVDDPANRMLREAGGGLLGQRLRSDLDVFLHRTLAERPAAGILRAVTLGVRDGIDEAQWEIFRRTGTSHLVAISGLHVGLVFGFTFALASLLARLCPPLLRRLPAQRLAALAALPPTLFYAHLAGFSLPTQRAAVMLAVFYLAYLCGRRVMGWHTFCVALAAVAVLDPFASLSQGFWLSFGAVAAIVLYANRSGAMRTAGDDETLTRRVGARLVAASRGWLGIQLAVSAVVVPLAGLFFGQLAIASPLFNLLAIPWFSVAVVPPALLGVFSWLAGAPGIAAGLLSLSERATSLLQNLLAAGAAPAFVAFDCDALDVARLGLVLLLAAGIVTRLRVTPAAPVALSMLMAVSRVQPPQPGTFTLSVLDVGQGLSVLLRTRNHALVFDTGIRYGPGYDMGRIVVNPYLSRSGVDSLDTLVISHGDRDHAGGRASVTRAHPDALVYDSERGRRGPGFPCVDGVRWSFDGVGFEFLSPADISRRSDNNRSCVLRVFSPHGQALLPGDIEVEAERRLVARHRDSLASDVLVVPHHGSRTSSSRILLKAVEPTLAIVSRGLSNPFGHPHDDVRKRIAGAGATLLDTALDGAVTVRVGPEGTTVRAHRHVSRPLWRSRPGRADP